jgi:20S proteasome alpha/beta subunit
MFPLGLDPSGTFSEWKANAVGKNSKAVREFLEKKYSEDITDDGAIELAIRSLMEAVESGSKVCVSVEKKLALEKELISDFIFWT